MPFEAEIRSLAVELDSYEIGRHDAICPRCSAQRKPQHQRLKVLGVTIEAGKFFGGCNHCGWTFPEAGFRGDRKPANGSTIYNYGPVRKVRLPPGSKIPFVWEHKNGKGEWEKTAGSTNTGTLLYRLEEVEKAIERGDTILVVEGEKDVNTCWRLGFAATCSASGAAKPDQRPKWNSRHSAQLSGANLVVFNDNDPQGYAHAEATCACSMQYAASVRRLDLKDYWAEIKEGQDISDWIALGHTADDLRALIPLAKPYTTATPPPRTPPPAAAMITEQSVMRDFATRFKDQLRFNCSASNWLVWTQHYWKIDPVARAFRWSLDLCRTLPPGRVQQKVGFARAVETAARVQAEFATSQEEWDRDPWLLGTAQGVVDLRTGELRGGSPRDLISKIAATSPSDNADCPRWIAFLNFALRENDAVISFLQRYAGYCLTGSVREECLVYLVGKGGTGKGTTTRTMQSIMGDYASSVPMSMFTDPGWRALEYYRAQLPGRRLVIASEPEDGAIWNEAFINELTGNDHLTGRHPRGIPFTFDPTHKIWMNGNSIPSLKGTPSGLTRRLCVVEFNRPPERADETLKEALRQEWPGIMRWMIEGCTAWQRHGLVPPTAVKEASAEYFDLQNTFRRWVEEDCVIDYESTLAPSLALQIYNAWALKNAEKPMTANQFHTALKRFDDARVRQGKFNGKREVRGLRLKSGAPGQGTARQQDFYDRDGEGHR